MSINDPTPRAHASQPRAAIVVNGTVIGGVVAAEVDTNAFYQADTCRVVLAISAQPRETGPAWWSAIDEAEIEILIGYPADAERYSRDELTSVFVGVADDIEIDLTADRITILGRDLTARFVDNKTVEQHRNLTASQIVELLARRRGLAPQVTATRQKAGGYYTQDHVDIEDSRPEWDLLTYLAEREGFRVYVSGRTLYFGPGTPDPEPYVVRWLPPDAEHAYPRSNALSLTMRRNLTVSRSIVVQVRSWNQKSQDGFTEQANRNRRPGQKNRSLGGSMPVQTYTFRVANLSRQQAVELANRKLEELSRHELVINARLVGDALLGINRMLQIEGTGTEFDQAYFPASIVRRYSLDEGYTMDCHAKNADANSTVLP